MTQAGLSTEPAASLPAPIVPGALPLRNTRHESYAKLRALNIPACNAAQQSGLEPRNGAVTKLERNRKIKERIAWWARQDEEILREKRAKLEQFLWAVHDCNYADFWDLADEEVLDEDGEPTGETRKVQKLKFFADVPRDMQLLVESLKYTEKGRPILSLYSKMQANMELRKLNMIGGGNKVEAAEGADDYGRLTDAELVEAIARQARELGRYDQLFASIGGAT